MFRTKFEGALALTLVSMGCTIASSSNTAHPETQSTSSALQRSAGQSAIEIRLSTTAEVRATPRAKLVAKLRALRSMAIADGLKLQTIDEIRHEIEMARDLEA